ncbi:hypothetical protein RDABS01_013922 [Bienertia sinuspersici]
MKAVMVTKGSILKPFGSKVFSNKHGFIYLLAPTKKAQISLRDFEKTGVNNLVTVGADAIFLDFPNLDIPSAEKMLKQHGSFCSFSPYIEQVQRSCETLNLKFIDIRTFKILLRTYDVKETRVEFSKGDDGFSFRSAHHKKDNILLITTMQWRLLVLQQPWQSHVVNQEAILVN